MASSRGFDKGLGKIVHGSISLMARETVFVRVVLLLGKLCSFAFDYVAWNNASVSISYLTAVFPAPNASSALERSEACLGQ